MGNLLAAASKTNCSMPVAKRELRRPGCLPTVAAAEALAATRRGVHFADGGCHRRNGS